MKTVSNPSLFRASVFFSLKESKSFNLCHKSINILHTAASTIPCQLRPVDSMTLLHPLSS